MDATTLSTKQMYEEFPYPSRELGTVRFKELRNLLHIFSLETGFDFRGKSVLDAGTGTGHRLALAASAFPDARFTAVDLSGNALAIARSHPSLEKARFEQANLAEDLTHLGTFDVILCMGVLHHLAAPLQGLVNLVGRLNDHGLIFLYVYGARGAAERMRRKEIVRTLLGGDGGFAEGVQLIKDLGFDNFEYGWNVQTDDERVREGLLVDAYLNVHETAYTSDTLEELIEQSGLGGFALYGITTAQAGYLFDPALAAKSKLGIPRTEAARFLKTALARDRYERLTITEKLRLLDLFYQPNGYTVLGFNHQPSELIDKSERLQRAMVSFQQKV